MRARAALAVLAAALFLAALPASSSAGDIRSAPGRLVDSQGRTVILRGVNLAFKRPPYLPAVRGAPAVTFNASDARRLRRWGMNSIRLGIAWRGLQPTRGAVSKRYVAGVRRIVRTAAREGLTVLVDMHQDLWADEFGGNGAPAWATLDDGLPVDLRVPFPLRYAQPGVARSFTSFWQDRAGIQTEFIAAYAALARGLRRERGVLGYDLFNEPSCEPSRPPCGFPPPPAGARELLVPFYTRLIGALRRADPSRPAFAEDWITTGGGNGYTLGQPPNPRPGWRNTGFSFHLYCFGTEAGRPCAEPALARAAAAARRLNGAPLLTEFGYTEDLGAIRTVVDAADGAGASWMYWTYKGYADPNPGVAPDGHPDSGSLVATDGRVKVAKVALLTRPYPERIAGRKARWSFDPATRAFLLRYVATDRHGRTVVRLPPAAYPRGYVLRVSGARVHAAPGASRLELRARRRGPVTLKALSAAAAPG